MWLVPYCWGPQVPLAEILSKFKHVRVDKIRNRCFIPTGPGWLLPSTEIPTGKMMPWLPSEAAMGCWNEHRSWALRGLSAAPARLLQALLPMGFLSGADTSPQLGHHWHWGQQFPALAGCCRWAAGWEHCSCDTGPRKCLSFSNIFTFWSMGKIRSWLGLQWETSVHCKGPLKLNRWSRV